jgi:hypothetical protein
MSQAQAYIYARILNNSNWNIIMCLWTITREYETRLKYRLLKFIKKLQIIIWYIMILFIKLNNSIWDQYTYIIYVYTYKCIILYINHFYF